MASFTKVGNRWRAQIRRRGETACNTFLTKTDAKLWADNKEREMDILRSGGLMAPKCTVDQLIERYEREVYKLKPWAESKSHILKMLKHRFRGVPVEDLTKAAIIAEFTEQSKTAAGSCLMTRSFYLKQVIEAAHDLWSIDAPVAAINDARKVMFKHGMLYPSNERERRVTDEEIERIVSHIEKLWPNSDVPMRDITHFALVTAMRGKEIAALRWDDLVEGAEPIILVRGRKHPDARKQAVNHAPVPLLQIGAHNAYEIIQRQPRTGPLIFPHRRNTFAAYFLDTGKFLEIDDLHFHDLRHEGISRMFEADFRIEQVALVSGHKDWKHLKRYANMRPKSLHSHPTQRPNLRLVKSA